MLRMLISGAFLLGFLLPSAGAQDFDARYQGNPIELPTPASTRNLIDFVQIASDAGLYDLALAAIDRHLTRFPLDGETQLAAARLYQHLGKDEHAANHASLALSTGLLNETQMRRAAFLRASVTRRTEPALASLEPELSRPSSADSATARGLRTESRDRLAENAPAEIDDAVLRRIRGSASATGARLGAVAAPAPGMQTSEAQANTDTAPGLGPAGGTLAYHAYQDTANSEAPVPSRVDYSLRYTFALY